MSLAPVAFLEPGAQPASELPPDTRLRAESRIDWLPASKISRDERVNTRPVDEPWVSARAREFDWNFLGTFVVSERGDGTKIILDGQNRLALLSRIGQPGADIKCEVFTGLSLAEEARLFLGLNAGRPVKPVSLFLAQVTMGDPVATAVSQIVTDCSWKIAAVPGRGVLLCTSALVRLHSRDLAANGTSEPPRVLHETLMHITKAWGQAPQAGHESVVTGIGKIMLKHGISIREDRAGGVTGPDRIHGILTAFGSDPSQLLDTAKSYQGSSLKKIGLPVAVADVILQEWNHGRQSRRLEYFAR